MSTVHLCTVSALTFALAASASGGPVGWRTDGTGTYSEATPPTEWAPDKNIVWKTPLPKWSNASPTVVGERMFVCAEPDKLICLRTSDGEILWTKSADYSDVFSEQQMQQMKEAGGEARALEAKMNPLKKQQRKLNKKVKALQTRKKRAPATAPADPALEKEIEQIKGQLKQLGAELKVLQEQLKPFNAAGPPKAHNTNGYSSATPASDGRVVVVVFGTGVVACYDMKGDRKWVTFIEKPMQRQGYGHCASPLIAGDKVLVVIRNVTALDLKSGKVVWTVKSKNQWGSPVAARIGDTDVAITANGKIVRIADGTVLAGGVSKLEYCAAVVKDGIAYFIENGGKAIRLPAKASDSIEVEELWKTTPKKDRYYASPVVHDGLIYACTQKQVFSVIDAEDGKVVYEKKLNLGGGTMYPSITLAGGLLYVSIDNGTTIVLEPGREYKEIARNKLEPFRSTPVFIGKRMYVRGLKNLYCVGE